MGIAGFGHNFGSLDGKSSPVSDMLDTAASAEQSWMSQFFFLLGGVFPIFVNIPTGRNVLFKKLRLTMGQVAEELLDRTRREKAGNMAGEAQAEERSIIGLLRAWSYCFHISISVYNSSRSQS